MLTCRLSSHITNAFDVVCAPCQLLSVLREVTLLAVPCVSGSSSTWMILPLDRARGCALWVQEAGWRHGARIR